MLEEDTCSICGSEKFTCPKCGKTCYFCHLRSEIIDDVFYVVCFFCKEKVEMNLK